MSPQERIECFLLHAELFCELGGQATAALEPLFDIRRRVVSTFEELLAPLDGGGKGCEDAVAIADLLGDSVDRLSSSRELGFMAVQVGTIPPSIRA